MTLTVPSSPLIYLASLYFFYTAFLCQPLFPLGLRFPLETTFHFMILVMDVICAVSRPPLSFHIAVPGRSPNKA